MESQPHELAPAPHADGKPLPHSAEHFERPLFEKVLFGAHGFRVGWPVAVGVLLAYFLDVVLESIAWATGSTSLHLPMDKFGAPQSILEELASLVSLVIAVFIASRMDGRRLPDYFIRDRSSFRHAFAGVAAGLVALSLLVGMLCAGGWLHLSYAGLDAGQSLRFAALWAFGFLLVGLTEEGLFRCFLLGTLERGMNFWWAAATVAGIAGCILANHDSHGAGGVYVVIALGVTPCLWIHQRKLASSQFWQTAWATSAAFGFVHTFNNGETPVGIFCTALIGFTFCVSIRVTGSAWWAIGFHAAWDWAQTYFYGTADSGLVPEGHLLSSTTSGSLLWNGGKAGPEGSVLAIPLTLVILAALVIYGNYYGNRYEGWVGREGQPLDAPSPLRQAQLS